MAERRTEPSDRGGRAPLERRVRGQGRADDAVGDQPAQAQNRRTPGVSHVVAGRRDEHPVVGRRVRCGDQDRGLHWQGCHSVSHYDVQPDYVRPSHAHLYRADRQDSGRAPPIRAEEHPATEAVCALVKDSQRPPKEIDPEGRLGVEGLVDRHDIHTPLGKALTEFLDPLFAALGIDLDLALRHFVAMMKDAVSRKDMAAKADQKKTGRRTKS